MTSSRIAAVEGVPSALLLADDPMTAEMMAFLLRRNSLEVVVAGSISDAPGELAQRTFDLVLLYCQKFSPAHLDVVRVARTESDAAILIVAHEQDNAAILAAYQAGADDYFPLPTSPAVLLAKVNVWLRRTAVVSLNARTGLQVGILRIDPAKKRVYGPYGPAVRLSTLETRVLHLLMLHPGDILPAAYILERVWGCNGKEDAGLVKNVIYRLRRKIEMPSGGMGCIETAEGGYVFQVAG